MVVAWTSGLLGGLEGLYHTGKGFFQPVITNADRGRLDFPVRQNAAEKFLQPCDAQRV